MNRWLVVSVWILVAAVAGVYARQRVVDHTYNTYMEQNIIRLTVNGDKTFTVTLADNRSARALKEQLAKGDITVRMEDYGGMEKVGPLNTALPRCDERIEAGPGRSHSLSRQVLCYLLCGQCVEPDPSGQDR